MSAIKITPADKAFSDCIRALAGWRCERCHTYYPAGPGRSGLHCSHFHGRGKWGTRFHPNNASSLCYGCHRYFGSNPSEHQAWFTAKIGVGAMEALQDAVNDTYRAREYKRTKGKGDIAKHYRGQLVAIASGQRFIVEYL